MLLCADTEKDDFQEGKSMNIKINYTKKLLILVVLMSCASQKLIKKEKSPIEKSFEQKVLEASSSKSFIDQQNYLIASNALVNENYELALEHFKAIEKTSSRDSFLKRKIAITLIKSSKLKESLDYLKSVYKDSKEKDTQIGLVLAGVYTGLDQKKEAQNIYRKILKVDPKHVDACVFLGKSYALNNQFKRGKETLLRCAKKHKTKGIFEYYVGKMYVSKENYKKALSFFQKALRRDPHYYQAALGVGLIYEQNNQNIKASHVYKKTLKKSGDNIAILNRLVSLLFSMQKYEELLPFAERLSDYDQNNLNLKVKLGILYTDTKRYSKAIATFKDLVALSPQNDKLLYYLGAIYQETKKYQDAIEYFTMITPDSGLYKDSSVQIAQMLGKMASLDSKVEYDLVSFISNRSILLKELKVEFNVILANHYERTMQYEKAASAMSALKNLPEFKESHFFYLAALYEKNKKFNLAYNVMYEVLKNNPNNAHAMNFIGYSYVEREIHLDKAYDLLKKASGLRPKDGFIMDSLGWYYYKVGDFNKALKIITKAASLVSNDPSIQKHMAIIHAKLNNFKMAKFYLKSAMKYSSNEGTIQELKSALKILGQKRFPASFK